LICGIPDHERDARFRMGRARRHDSSERDQRKQGGDERANPWHDCSIESGKGAQLRSDYTAIPLNGV
jgi:hypothetical protein